MEKFIVLAAITIVIGPIVYLPVLKAANQPKICESDDLEDSGYTIVIASDFKTAQVVEESSGGPLPAINMNCEYLGVPQNIVSGSLNNYLLCREENLSEGGLIARAFVDGPAGLDYVSLRRVTHMTEHEVLYGHLNCKR